jgi:transcriptional regulator with XRE-family HTH domain
MDSVAVLPPPTVVDRSPNMGALRDDLSYFMHRRGFDNANELAHAAGLSWPTVADILSGKTTRPRTETLEHLAKALGLPVQILEESAAQSAYGVEALHRDPDVQIVAATLDKIADPDERAAFVALIEQLAKRYMH